MISKYWLVMKCEDGRVIRDDFWHVVSLTREGADCEAMEMFGKQLINEARAIRRQRAAA